MVIAIRKYFAIIITIVFFIALFFIPAVFYLIGLLPIVIIISALKKTKIKKALVIASPIATFPAFLLLMFRFYIFFPVHPLIYVLVYALLYLFIFQDLPEWLEKKSRVLTMILLVYIGASVIAYGALIGQCSTEPISDAQISICNTFSLYAPSIAHKFSGLFNIILHSISYGVGLTSLVAALVLFVYQPQHNK